MSYAVGKKGWIPADAFETVSTVPENPTPETPTTDANSSRRE